MDEHGRPNTMEELEALLATLPDAADPYEVAIEVYGCANDVMDVVEDGEKLFLLWACFTDWVEMEPNQEAQAGAAMRAAALQWPEVKDSAAARDAYFDHWMFDVIEVRTALPPGWTMRFDEVSADAYRATATHEDGRSVNFTGADRLALMTKVRQGAEELTARDRMWNARDAWILQAIVRAGRRGDLAAVIRNANAINADIPTRAMLEASVNKLLSAGLVRADADRLRATRAGRRLLPRAPWRRGIRTVTTPLAAKLEAEVPAPPLTRPWTLSDADWQAAHDRYRQAS